MLLPFQGLSQKSQKPESQKVCNKATFNKGNFQFWTFSSKRGSLLGNEEIHLVGDSPIFEIEYSNLEERSNFSKKSTHFYVGIK